MMVLRTVRRPNRNRANLQSTATDISHGAAHEGEGVRFKCQGISPCTRRSAGYHQSPLSFLPAPISLSQPVFFGRTQGGPEYAATDSLRALCPDLSKERGCRGGKKYANLGVSGR